MARTDKLISYQKKKKKKNGVIGLNISLLVKIISDCLVLLHAKIIAFIFQMSVISFRIKFPNSCV